MEIVALLTELYCMRYIGATGCLNTIVYVHNMLRGALVTLYLFFLIYNLIPSSYNLICMKIKKKKDHSMANIKLVLSVVPTCKLPQKCRAEI
jgi:hypothetical protein